MNPEARTVTEACSQEASWEEVVLWHSEPYFEGREHQIEVVVDNDQLLIADTGDIIKDGSSLIMFVTPGSLKIPVEWTHDVADRLKKFGYKNQAMDIEVIFAEQVH